MNEQDGEDIEPTSENQSDQGEERATESAPASDALAEAKAETARMKDQWVRTAADFDNFRKRTRREIEDARKGGREDLLREILPVFDNLERAIQSAQSATEAKPVADGLTMILRQLVDTLARVGITKVPAVGQRFDPAVHDAIQQLDTDEHPAGTVVAEVQPGYLQGDRLVRAAMVIVAKPKTNHGGHDDADPSESSE
ncbi:MAG: nucleotide exchange factor GrpE [Polyangiaceae bacterium]|nr:nucleotide exchange factor GrpE [Polyangiaceae bacterium]